MSQTRIEAPMRQLQLNHPLNYLVVPFFAASKAQGSTVLDELAMRWPDLESAGTRKHAVSGAVALYLLDANQGLTAEGRIVADLLSAVRFDPQNRPPKSERLANVAPQLAAIARSVFIQQPSVRLIIRALADSRGSLKLPDLAATAAHINHRLGTALFLCNPAAQIQADLPGSAFVPSTVFKLKQNLWHAGFLETPRHSSSGKSADEFLPQQDHWNLSAEWMQVQVLP